MEEITISCSEYEQMKTEIAKMAELRTIMKQLMEKIALQENRRSTTQASPDIERNNSINFHKNMLNSPLVAIVIPVYNTEKYIAECLDHILAQTYSNWVCLITDNASTDNTVSIIKRYTCVDTRFQLFQNTTTVPAIENWNIAYSRVLGFEAKYAKLEPADDWMYPEFLEKMIAILELDEDIGACFSFRLDGQIVNCFGLNIYEGNVFNGKMILHAELIRGLWISGSLGSPLYRVSALKSISPVLHVYNEKNIHADTELAHDIMQRYNIGFVYQVLSYFRWHNDALTSSIAKRYNTYQNGHEQTLYKRLDIFPDLYISYHVHRLFYAWFLLKKRKNKECIEWHTKHLERPISTKEYILSPFFIFMNNNFKKTLNKLLLFLLHKHLQKLTIVKKTLKHNSKTDAK
jgi:glycosyltransferase involved in cell wall biosynthesis